MRQVLNDFVMHVGRENKQLQILAAFGNASAKQITGHSHHLCINVEHEQYCLIKTFADLKKLEDASVDDELKVACDISSNREPFDSCRLQVLNLIEDFGIREQKKDVSSDDSGILLSYHVHPASFTHPHLRCKRW
jgi:hypothetical protein